MTLLKRVLADPGVQAWQLGNLDATILAERPRLAPHIPRIRQRLATLFAVDMTAISVKATTVEGTDAIGAGTAMGTHALVLLNAVEPSPP